MEKEPSVLLTHGGGDHPAENQLVSNIGTLIDGAPPPNVTIIKSEETLDDTLLEKSGETHHTVTIVTKDGAQHIIELPAAMGALSAEETLSEDAEGDSSSPDQLPRGTHTLLLDGHTNTVRVITYPLSLTEASEDPDASDSVPKAENSEETTSDSKDDLSSVVMYETSGL